MVDTRTLNNNSAKHCGKKTKNFDISLLSRFEFVSTTRIYLKPKKELSAFIQTIEKRLHKNQSK